MAQEPLELSAHDNTLAIQGLANSDVELIVECYSGYIVEQVERLIGHRASFRCTSMLDKDDIAQLVLIKFWQALQKRNIIHPRAYIKRMIYNEFVNMWRGCKLTLPLSINDDEEEVRDSSAILIPCEEKDLPEFQVEQEDTAFLCANRAARAIGALAPRQKRAMECSLYEHLDDPEQFKNAFKIYGLHMDNAKWPAKKADRQLLNASLSAARTNVALCMNFDLKRYKQKGASYLR